MILTEYNNSVMKYLNTGIQPLNSPRSSHPAMGLYNNTYLYKATHCAEVFFRRMGATIEADPWTDKQEAFRPRVSS